MLQNQMDSISVDVAQISVHTKVQIHTRWTLGSWNVTNVMQARVSTEMQH